MVTGKVRASYPNIFKASASFGAEPSYNINLLIPKTDVKQVEAIKAAIEDAKKNSAEKWGGKIPANIKSPLRDGDEERADKAGYAGCYFINAKSKNKPKVYDRDGSEIIDPEEVYPGCYVRADISFYGYSVNGNKGIAAGLNAVMKWTEGERLAGHTVSPDAFNDGYEDDDDIE